MQAQLPDLAIRSTFHPDGDASARRELDEQFIAGRRDFAVDALRQCVQRFGSDAAENLSSGSFSTLLVSVPEHRALLVDPVFTVWVRVLAQALAQGRLDLAAHHLEQLPGVLGRVWQRLAGRDAHYVGGTTTAVQGDDIDPYVMAVTPPSYDFTVPRRPGLGHSLALEAELIGLALTNIGGAWADERDEICELVQIVGYLPDATFTSCSAARYAGVVYLGNSDESILDLEESLIHEAGHQRLYRLGEVTPLTTPDAPRTTDFVLPWSSSERDLFGFLHACYIYVLLVKYFLRRRATVGDRAGNCQRRAELIFLGLLMAMPELSQAEHLSTVGRHVVAAMNDDLNGLRAELLES